VLLVALISLSGCATTAVQSWTLPNPFPVSPPTTPPTSTTATTVPPTEPIARVPVVCGGGYEVDEPASSSLDQLLLTVSDVPHGYISSGPDGATSSLLFGSELAPSVPVAAISYGEFSDSGSGVETDIINEALAEDTSVSAASSLAARLQRASAGCGPGSGTVRLPGPVPNLVATTRVRREVPTTLVINQVVDASSAEVYASKGPYLVEISWDNTSDITVSGALQQPALPAPTVMGSVADAALARIPG
jgi:hypothetical protein